MTQGRRFLVFGGVLAATAVIIAAIVVSRTREGRRTTSELQSDIAALRAERDRLRPQVIGAMSLDPRLMRMPDREVRVGVPTALARDIITTLIAGVPEHLTLALEGLHVHRSGAVRRIVPLGTYDLDVNVTRVTARFTTGTPEITFAENRLNLVLPVRIASGSGSASIDYVWDGRTVGQAACGDMHFTKVVTGTVTPASYRLSGTLELSVTDEAILLTPRFPPRQVLLRVAPSAASWALVQETLDAVGGICGFVLDRVNIRGALEEFIGKGFSVRLPTDRLNAIALPVGITSAMTIHGVPIRFSGTEGSATIGEDMIWVSANVTVVNTPERQR